ncbi:MAG: hypothetical protein LBC04_02795 [Holosporaceae bacterium]|nr:hypothetical protein [Holosporaceae bacterium]
MNCPKCGGTEAVKAGTAREIQRSGIAAVTKSSKRGHPNSIKLKAIISKRLWVSP